MWALNGWSQSMGAGPAIIALSRWFSPKERGTYYGFFSASHNLGEFFSFIFVGSVVGWLGWQAGFMGSFIAGAIGVLIIIFFLHDSPESKGLPHVGNPPKESTDKAQKGVLRNPYVWILALASAFMYVSRYAVNSWGVRFLEMEKGYSLELATTVIGINALLGIFGVAAALNGYLFRPMNPLFRIAIAVGGLYKELDLQDCGEAVSLLQSAAESISLEMGKSPD